MQQYDVLILGGGLAGLTASIQLALKNLSVCVFEKEKYPKHRVCGEYVSNEILPYLESLGVKIASKSVAIDTLQLSTVSGKCISVDLPLGGAGISRYSLDQIAYLRAVEIGVDFVFETVDSIHFENSYFECTTLETNNYKGTIALGAFGKRSNLDKFLNREFITNKSSWMAVKAHYHHNGLPDNQVALHNFKGGYGGLSKVEDGIVNFCYLSSYQSFKRHKDIDNFNTSVVCENPYLNTFLKSATPIFDKPMTIAQLSFEPKASVENHILMIGDTAGLIHPLCGNGMAMAIHSAKIASEGILRFFDSRANNRYRLENDYEKEWNDNFANRIGRGRQLQSLLLSPRLSAIAIATIAKSPWLLNKIISQTHGSPIDVS